MNWEGIKSHSGSLKDWWTKISAAKNYLEIQDKHEWQIWKDRNGWLFNGEKRKEIEIVLRA